MTTPENLPGQSDPNAPIPGGPENFGDIVQRLEDLVKFTLECEKKELRDDVSFVDVYNQLTLIKEGVELLNQQYLVQLEMLAAQGQIPSDVPMSSEDKKLYDKLGNLKEVCEEAKARLHESLQQSPIEVQQLSDEIKDSSSTEKQKARRRKSKFKGVGGKKGWSPA